MQNHRKPQGLEIRFMTALDERFVNSDSSGTLWFEFVGDAPGQQ